MWSREWVWHLYQRDYAYQIYLVYIFGIYREKAATSSDFQTKNYIMHINI